MKYRAALYLILLLLLSTVNNLAQEKVKLWENGAPTENKITEPEKWKREGDWVSNIIEAELYIYMPAVNKEGKVVIICPGGGYAGLAISHKGKDFAVWLNSKGITAIVPKYRIPNKNTNVPLDDAQQAICYVRAKAERLGVNNKVGIAGFSAGGYLASPHPVSTHYAVGGVNTILYSSSKINSYYLCIIPTLYFLIILRVSR